MMIRDLSHLNFKIVSEWTEYFRDMLHLKGKLQEAKGDQPPMYGPVLKLRLSALLRRNHDWYPAGIHNLVLILHI